MAMRSLVGIIILIVKNRSHQQKREKTKKPAFLYRSDSAHAPKQLKDPNDRSTNRFLVISGAVKQERGRKKKSSQARKKRNATHTRPLQSLESLSRGAWHETRGLRLPTMIASRKKATLIHSAASHVRSFHAPPLHHHYTPFVHRHLIKKKRDTQNLPDFFLSACQFFVLDGGIATRIVL